MRRIPILILVLIGWCLPINPASADEIGDLKNQIKELTGIVKDLKSTVESQQQEINSLKSASTTRTAPQPLATAPSTETQEQIQSLNEKVDSVIEAQKKTLPSEFNPSIGLVGETVFSTSNRNSDETGNERPGQVDINQRSIELNLAASVDPFAKGYAVINASADATTGEATATVEEAALETTSLPWNLTLKGGRFFGEFGRLAYIHDHELPFVNRPLALDQYIGGESQTDGVQLSWLLPTEHYINLTVGTGNHFGDPLNDVGASRNFQELNYFGRLSTYFDLPNEWQFETGVSGLINPRTDSRGDMITLADGTTLTERRRYLGGADFALKWVPLQDNQFKGFTWGNEVLFSDNHYLHDPDATPNTGDEFNKAIGSVGAYSYIAYKMNRQWTAGFLFDTVQNQTNKHDQTYAYSPYLTYALSHWNQLRLQYTHTDRDPASGLKDDDAVYLQWTWIIGSHSHGWQQR